MTNEEREKMVEKIYAKVRNIPGIDKNLINKCLIGVSSLNDKEVEEKLKQLAKLF